MRRDRVVSRRAHLNSHTVKTSVPFVANLLLCAAFTTCLSSCGSGQKPVELAQERPFGVINGHLYDGMLSNATVTAYTYGSVEDRKFLAKANINENGNYQLPIQAPSQVIILEVDSKTYSESSSNILVDVPEGKKLNSIVYYISGKTQSATVTALTHLESGLTQFGTKQGKDPKSALEDANQEFTSLYGFSPTQTLPVNELTLEDDTPDSDEEIFYGLLLAGLSELTKNISLSSEPNLHETLNTWDLSQILYKDINSDGILDGKWKDEVAKEDKPLSFGNVTTSAAMLQSVLASEVLDTKLYHQLKLRMDPDKIENFLLQFSSNESTVLNSQKSQPLNTPIISLNNPLKDFYSGDFPLSAGVTGVLKLHELKYTLDGTELENDLSLPGLSTTIHSKSFADGKHMLTLVATDVFGNQGSATFEITLDNSSPGIEVSSPLRTNRKNYRLSGTFSEGGSGISEIVVNQKKAVLSNNENWFVDLDLMEGENEVLLTAIDVAQNKLSKNIRLILDTKAPEFDTTDKHSEATFFIDNNDYYIDVLKNSNNLPIFLSSDKLSLGGDSISLSVLQASKIPYFAFTTKDPISENQATEFSNLDVKIRVEKNGVVERDWFEIAPDGEQYPIPMTREIFGNEIIQARISDQYIVRALVKDEAGNENQIMFEFTAAIFSPAQKIELAETPANENWKNISFQNRTQLNNKELKAVQYHYTNTSPASIYINPAELNKNRVVQVYEQVKRENKVRLKTTPSWRIRKVDNPIKTCPGIEGTWQMVDQVFNYTGTNGWEKERPQIEISNPQAIDQDVPSPLAASQWMDLPDFDSDFESVEVPGAFGDLITYQRDYVLDTSISGLSQPALLMNWKYHLQSENKTTLCNDIRNIQFMEEYEYLPEPGYPRNNLIEKSNETEFQTSQFKVFDESGVELIANDGWYKIPALQKATIEKYVQTNELTMHNAEAVKTPELITDYETHELDSKITWLISQSIAVKFAHDLDNKINEAVLSHQSEYTNEAANFSLSRD